MPEIEEIVEEPTHADIATEIPSSTVAATPSLPSSSASGHGDPSVASLASQIMQELPGPTTSPSQKKPSIFKVPSHLRTAEPEAYEPRLVSIGPLHHKKNNLLPMEVVKRQYLQDLLNRDGRNSVENYVEEISNALQQAKEHYSEDILVPNDNELVKMLVIDGCFIIEIVTKWIRYEEQITSLADRRWGLSQLLRDLFLLENQIPFIVLTGLFEKTEIPLPIGSLPLQLLEATGGDKRLFLKLLFLKVMGVEVRPQLIHNMVEPYHLLHFWRLCFDLHLEEEIPAHCCRRLAMFIRKMCRRVFSFLFFGLFSFIFCCRSPSYKAIAKKMKAHKMIPCATELRAAGITFKRKVFSKIPRFPHFKVSFRGGTLEIPVIIVDDEIGPTLRNFIALEQLSEDIGSHYTSYCIFMADIIKTPSDVAILRNCGIRKGIYLDFDKNDNAQLYSYVVAYCGFCHREWRTSLVHNYFSKPWAIFSVLGAFALLGLTATQTYFAAKAFYEDNKKNR